MKALIRGNAVAEAAAGSGAGDVPAVQRRKEITVAVYARDKRPVVAPPPAYTTATAIPGLTPADSALLASLIEEALAAE